MQNVLTKKEIIIIEYIELSVLGKVNSCIAEFIFMCLKEV